MSQDPELLKCICDSVYAAKSVDLCPANFHLFRIVVSVCCTYLAVGHGCTDIAWQSVVEMMVFIG